MTALGVLLTGLLLVYLGGTDKLTATWSALNTAPTGYKGIPFLRFLAGLAVVSIPVVILDRQGEDEWVNRYVLLLTLSTLIINANELKRFTTFLGKL